MFSFQFRLQYRVKSAIGEICNDIFTSCSLFGLKERNPHSSREECSGRDVGYLNYNPRMPRN